jgi:methylenetetrahydrofolate dehydrogenase (NADP+)/methenyltetrahydrofolate cyclohydrolase
MLLSAAADYGNATVTLCHSRTQNLKEYTLQADILVVALGRPGFVTADMVKPGAVVVDVGTTRVDDASKKAGWKLMGDVDYPAIEPIASAITPVPKGVGPMTITGLMMNTLVVYKEKFGS